MVLIFVKQNDADTRPRARKVEAGQIINLAGLDALVVDKPSKEDLEKGMTKQQMLSIIHGLGMRITHEGRASKGVIADLILANWDNKIMSKFRTVSSQPASSDDAQTSSYPVSAVPTTTDAQTSSSPVGDVPVATSPPLIQTVEIFSSKDFRKTKQETTDDKKNDDEYPDMFEFLSWHDP